MSTSSAHVKWVLPMSNVIMAFLSMAHPVPDDPNIRPLRDRSSTRAITVTARTPAALNLRPTSPAVP